MQHLGDAATAELQLSDAERVVSIERRRWYAYTQADAIQERLTRLREYPRGPRMPCLLMVGESGNGKTSILNRFVQTNPMYDNPSGEGKIIPVLFVQAPPSADEGQFHSDILTRLCAEFNRNSRAPEKRSQVVDLLRAVELKMLIVDELHNIASGTGAKQQNFLTLLKYMTNELDLSIVSAGTDEALSAVTADRQMESRFEILELPLWREGEDFLRLLDSLEYRLPLKKPSRLASGENMTLILDLSNGILVKILSIVKAAAIRAIQNGRECITRNEILGVEGSADSKARSVG